MLQKRNFDLNCAIENNNYPFPLAKLMDFRFINDS